MLKKVSYVDLFCGAGGFTTGAMLAAADLGISLEGLAINHWDVAIATHSENHPGVKHLCADVSKVDLDLFWPEYEMDLLLAAPECTHHSIARGGKPRDNQSRAQPFMVIDWLSKRHVKRVLLENVKEFLTWGPLDKHGKPIKGHKGALFMAFVKSLEALNYIVDWRIFNAADYGDPTTRQRLFIQAVKVGEGQIVWPQPTHSKSPESSHMAGLPLFGAGQDLKKWRAAREIIDWQIPGESIFGRVKRGKKPLAMNTLERISKGLEKFCGLKIPAALLDQACRGEVVPPLSMEALAQPFIGALNHGTDDSRVQDMGAPMPTITQWDAWGIFQPFIAEMYGTSTARSAEEPLSTITTSGAHHGIVEPFILSHPHGDNSSERSVEDPLFTVTARSSDMAVVEPVIKPAFFNVYHGESSENGARVASIEEPLKTVDTSNRYALVEPHLVNFNGTGTAHSVDQPIPTVTGNDRFGLVVVLLDGRKAILDIRFRMMAPHELAGAMSFPKGYIFTGPRRDKVKQIGNAVPIELARSLVKEIFLNGQLSTVA
jgi:DNA (cytosine-5)-methyltransferase 1